MALSSSYSFGMGGMAGKLAGMAWNAVQQIPLDKAFKMAGEAAGSAAEGIANGINAIKRQQEEAARREREEIERQREADLRTIADKWASEIEKKLAEARLKAADERLAALKKSEADFNAKMNDAMADASKLPAEGIRNLMSVGKEYMTAQAKLQEAVATEHVRAKGAAEAAERAAKAAGEAGIKKQKELLDFLGNPEKIKILAGGAVAVTAGFFAAKEGFKLLSDYIRHSYRNPELAQETSIVGFWDRTKDRLLGNKIVTDKVEDVVLSPDLAERIKSLAESTKQSVENNTNFRNILFYGPPGTGKTMLAKKIARASGLHYIYFSAADISQFSTEEALMKLRELFDFAKMQTERKLMIIIDEAEVVLPDRNKPNLSEKTRLILNELLTFFGTETKDYLLVALTNRAQDLDSAALSRFDEQVEIFAPNAPERNLILKKYINDFITTPQTDRGRRLTILGKLLQMIKAFGMKMGLNKPTVTPKLMVEPDALGDDMMRQLTERTSGFVGRDISKMILSMQVTALSSKNKTLTRDMILKILKQKIDQKQKENAGFRVF